MHFTNTRGAETPTFQLLGSDGPQCSAFNYVSSWRTRYSIPLPALQEERPTNLNVSFLELTGFTDSDGTVENILISCRDRKKGFIKRPILVAEMSEIYPRILSVFAAEDWSEDLAIDNRCAVKKSRTCFVPLTH